MSSPKLKKLTRQSNTEAIDLSLHEPVRSQSLNALSKSGQDIDKSSCYKPDQNVNHLLSALKQLDNDSTKSSTRVNFKQQKSWPQDHDQSQTSSEYYVQHPLATWSHHSTNMNRSLSSQSRALSPSPAQFRPGSPCISRSRSEEPDNRFKTSAKVLVNRSRQSEPKQKIGLTMRTVSMARSFSQNILNSIRKKTAAAIDGKTVCDSESGSEPSIKEEEEDTGTNNLNSSGLTRKKSGDSIKEVSYISEAESRPSCYLEQVTYSTMLPLITPPKLNELSLPIICKIYSVQGLLMLEVLIYQYELGRYLIDQLALYYKMEDVRFYGIKLLELPMDQDDLLTPWLDLDKKIFEEVNDRARYLHQQANKYEGLKLPQHPANYYSRSLNFLFRFRYYPPRMTFLHADNFMMGYLWLQLLRDLKLQRLVSGKANLTKLLALYLEFCYGAHNECLNVCELVKRIDLFPGQKSLENEAIERWQTRPLGPDKSKIQQKFIEACMRYLELYGCDMYSLKHHNKSESIVYLGFNFRGVQCLEKQQIVLSIPLYHIGKIDVEGKTLIINHHDDKSKRYQQGFQCNSSKLAQYLKRTLREAKEFFTFDLYRFPLEPRSLLLASSSMESNGGSTGAQSSFDTEEVKEKRSQSTPAVDMQLVPSRTQTPVIRVSSDDIDDSDDIQNKTTLVVDPTPVELAPSLESYPIMNNQITIIHTLRTLLNNILYQRIGQDRFMSLGLCITLGICLLSIACQFV